jgi:glycosyltransferase involved in cell wall biosynthesis
MSQVSIIVSFYKRVRHLEMCLASLAANAGSFDEVVVSDDGSPRETVAEVRALLKRQPFPARHVWQEKRDFRLAATRNHGVLHSTGDYLIFIDCDFLMLPGAIEAHRQLRRRGQFLAGHFKRLSERDTEELFRDGFDPRRAEALFAAYPDATQRQLHSRYRVRNLLMKMGLLRAWRPRLVGHVSVFREDFERINGYDENFVGWGGEDEDFGVRLVMAGVHCASAIHAARAMHMWHPTEMGGRHWSEHRNMKYMYRQEITPRCSKGYAEHADGHECADQAA